MNKQIKELAEQAGLQNTLGCFWQSGDCDLERFAEMVRQDEREACAKVCDEKALYFQYDFISPYDVADSCAEEIRKRGNE